jgi:hypothetical protein
MKISHGISESSEYTVENIANKSTHLQNNREKYLLQCKHIHALIFIHMQFWQLHSTDFLSSESSILSQVRPAQVIELNYVRPQCQRLAA